MPHKTLISHFWNEEVLLPFWLKHHVPMFDDGILIDYGSTDGSVEIIKELAPNWKIVQTQNPDFDGVTCDKEVMEYESSIDGWKIALNTTEFLLRHDFNSLLLDVENNFSHLQCLIATAYWIVDTPHETNQSIDYNIPLLRQRHYGIPPNKQSGEIFTAFRGRFLHRCKTGGYKRGRHNCDIPYEARGFFPQDLILAWTYWALHSLTAQRKMSIQTKMSKSFYEEIKGYHAANLRICNHVIPSLEVLDKRYAEVANHVTDLSKDANYYQQVIRLPLSYGKTNHE